MNELLERLRTLLADFVEVDGVFSYSPPGMLLGSVWISVEVASDCVAIRIKDSTLEHPEIYWTYPCEMIDGELIWTATDLPRSPAWCAAKIWEEHVQPLISWFGHMNSPGHVFGDTVEYQGYLLTKLIQACDCETFIYYWTRISRDNVHRYMRDIAWAHARRCGALSVMRNLAAAELLV